MKNKDKPVVIMTSGLGPKRRGNVSSRIGLARIPIFDETDLFHLIKDLDLQTLLYF